jgi:ADP-ribosyl-[dinitrogen reductase] hydrolase
MSIDAEQLESFVKGAIMGHLIGDALGYPYSFRENLPEVIDMIPGPSGEQAGSYQAPGALSLCTIANINEFGGIQLHDLMEKFHDFLIAGYLAPHNDIDQCADISPVTVEAIKKHTNGMPPDRCGSKKEDQCDNECLTRMLPIGLFYATEPVDKLIDTAHQVCAITHARVEHQVACTLYVMLVRNLLLQKAEKVFDFLEDYYKTTKRREHAEAVIELKGWKSEKQQTGGKQVQDCFWSAWKAYTLFERDYRFCVTSAIQMGNDANSTACVAGGLSALTNGLGDIPTPWLNSIALTSEVMEAVMTFTDKIVSRMTN